MTGATRQDWDVPPTDDEVAAVMEQATEYIRALEIACLTFYHQLDVPAVNIIREEFPEVMEFVVDLHKRLEH